MTVETRTLLELKDITGLELECPNCQAKFLYALHGQWRPTKIFACPNCKADWFVSQRPSDAPEMIINFLEHLERLAEHKDILAKIRLSISPRYS